jgi:glycosyltransferase involved in cell wall biosynthesis
MSIDYRVHKTALSLMDMGFAVHCITRHKKGFGKTSTVPYHIVVLPTFFKTGAAFYLEFNLRLFFYLLFHSSHSVLSIDLDTLPGCRLGTWINRRRLVFDSHEYFPEVPEVTCRPLIKKIWLMAEKLFIPSVDAAYTVCQSIADIYTHKYGKPFRVMRNLPAATRLEKVTPAITDWRFKIVYQGAVNNGRGILETLDAMQHLDDVLLIIVGDGDEMELVRLKVATMNLQDRVILTGKIPFSQLPAYTCSANAGLCLLENKGLNYYYSLPNRIFDFALAGVPIIASNFPEINAVVGKYNTGVLVDDLQPASIVAAIRQLKDDPTFCNVLSANAVDISKTLTWENEEAVLREIFLQ